MNTLEYSRLTWRRTDRCSIPTRRQHCWTSQQWHPAIIVSLTGVTALPMGTAFPSGIRLLGRSHENSIPWVWALNGGASVLGSIFAMAISMSAGYRLTLIFGSVIYLLAALVARRLAKTDRQAARTTQHVALRPHLDARPSPRLASPSLPFPSPCHVAE